MFVLDITQVSLPVGPYVTYSAFINFCVSLIIFTLKQFTKSADINIWIDVAHFSATFSTRRELTDEYHALSNWKEKHEVSKTALSIGTII